jgi:membrane protein DedA with SNARE-associated domain
VRSIFRVGPAALVLLPAIHLHHHHFHGLAGGYVGLGAAALASWIGFPGPGEGALVTAAIIAARGRLDLLEVILVAWGGATVGGVAGWAIGWKGGRSLVTTRGPFRRSRLRTLARTDRFYERYGALAVFFTPSWMAGIAEVRWPRFILANGLSALLWAIGFGVGAYFGGPPVVELIGDLGLAGSLIVLGILGGGIVAAELRRRRRRRVPQPERD